MKGRELLATEKKLPLLERILVVAVWFLVKFGKYCFYLPKVELILPT